MVSNKSKISGIIIVISLILLFTCQNRIEFEYYVWNLSSENFDIREDSFSKILLMGENTVPFIVKKLDHPYIFETDYLIKALENIVNLKVNYQNQNEAINFWKKWWGVNSKNY